VTPDSGQDNATAKLPADCDELVHDQPLRNVCVWFGITPQILRDLGRFVPRVDRKLHILHERMVGQGVDLPRGNDMTDHVSRMVNGWFEKAQRAGREREAVTSLVDSIHRLIREAERETQRRCAEVALRAGVHDAGKVALAIRTLGQTPRGGSDQAAIDEPL
jgi:hypothetical protein